MSDEKSFAEKLSEQIENNNNALLMDAMDTYSSLIVIGWDNEGTLKSHISGDLNAAEVNMLLDVFKNGILTQRLTNED